MDQARDVSMAPLEFQHTPASEYLDRYDGITSELNVNMEYDDAVDVTTTYLGHVQGATARNSVELVFLLVIISFVCI